MAEVLEPTGEVDAPRRRYPWDSWLDGRPWRLDPAEDFDQDPRSLRTYIYSMARARGLRVVIAIEPTDHMVIQAYDPANLRPKLPSAYRRLPNGKLDPTASAPSPAPAGERPTCTVCGKNLTPAGRPFGVCTKFNPSTGKFEPVHPKILLDE